MSTNRTQSTLRNYASAWKDERKHRDAAEFDAINAPERWTLPHFDTGMNRE